MSAITPGRRTIVTIDESRYRVAQPAVREGRRGPAIADEGECVRDLASAPANGEGYRTMYHPSVGWQLLSNLSLRTKAFEQTDFESAELNPENGNLEVSSIFASHRGHRGNNDLAGISGAPTGQGRYMQKSIAASEEWTTELDGDASAYPPPDDGGFLCKRLAATTADYTPHTHVSYAYVTASSLRDARYGVFSRLYFSGLAGSARSDGDKRGTGRYCLSLDSDGWAYLRERLVDPEGASSWKFRMSFRWGSEGAGTHGTFVVTIRSDAEYVAGKWRGTQISFDFARMGTGLRQALVGYFSKVLDPALGLHVYRVPSPSRYQPQPTKIRIDERADVRGKIRLYLAAHQPAGAIRSIVLDAKTILDSSEPIYATWQGYNPPGGAIVLEVRDAETDQLLTPVAGEEASYETWGYKGFDPASGRLPDTEEKRYTRRKYRITVRLSTTNPAFTPVVRGIELWKRASVEAQEGEAVTPSHVESVSILGADSDPSHETMRLSLPDPRNLLGLLKRRAQMPVRVDVRYDPADPSKVSTIGSGYVARASFRRVGSLTRNGDPTGATWSQMAAPDWGRFDVRCTGEWQRLWEAKTHKAWEFGVDKTLTGDTKPCKVTDIIRDLLEDAGYADEEIDVPDLPIRLFTSGDSSQTMKLEVHSEIGAFVVDLARDYLGAWLTWDANATSAPEGEEPTRMGCWRLLSPPHAGAPGSPIAHRPLCAFALRADAGPGIALAYPLPGQRKVEYGEREIPRAWIRKGSLSTYVVPPEANKVIVTGVGTVSDAILADGRAALTQTLYNYRSHKFAPDQPIEPDPEHPDYLGREVTVYYGDPSIGTQAHCDFVARRLFDVACHAQARAEFEAPLVLVTDEEDARQRRPRPLRYGDCVLLEGKDPDTGEATWVPMYVGSASIDYSAFRGGDRLQMSAYELFSPVNDSTFLFTAEGTR